MESMQKTTNHGQINGFISTAVSGVKQAAVDLATPATVQSTIRILSQLVDLGQSLPWISPVFVILGVIVNIEATARDADAKCIDLLERINFMTSHLSVLEKIQVMDATRHVVENMIGILKTAAALIQAYRKHGAIARRLNPGYRDKFASCAEAINVCSNDLMMSLQIQQTGQLSILTRSIPVDPEDEAAQVFIAQHGGPDVVNSDPTLVKEFAREQHMSLDDKSMEQINDNITNVMQQNQTQLEQKLSETVSTAVLDSLKELAALATEAEKEQVFKCVQCEKDFRNSTNGPASCSFHSAEYSSWNKSYPCCSTPHPCQFRSHRASHHCEYSYGPFFERSRKILNYIDTIEEWAAVKDVDLENNNNIQKAMIGRLLRWTTGGSRLNEPVILITVGTVWYSEPYFFDTFTVKNLEATAEAIGVSRKTTIFRTSSSNVEFALAEWLVSRAGVITGVRLTVKVATSKTPYVQVCPIDMTTGTKSGDILTISEGGIQSYAPATPYVIPETVFVGPELSDKPLRSVRTNFKTRTSSNLPIILKTVSEPPLKANPKFASSESDNFEGTISVFNKHLPNSPDPITISSVSASFRFIGDENYTPVTSLKVLNDTLPVTIEPRQSWTLEFRVVIPRSEDDAQHAVRWWNRAFCARHRPLRLKLTLQDIEDEECSLVLEYVFTPYPLEKPKADDLGFFYFDEPDLLDRHSIRVTKATSETGVVQFPSHEIDTIRLKQVIYHAMKTGETEVNLAIGGEQDGGSWEWAVWALVDLSCRRVYAFKVLLQQGPHAAKQTYACLGYVLCPDYENGAKKLRPISYAVEQVKFPDLEPFTAPEFPADDTVDDVVQDPPQPAKGSTLTAPSTVPPLQVIPSQELTQRLASIDSSLLRIAAAVEQLAAFVTKSKPADVGL
jgi:hypothetical protein